MWKKLSDVGYLLKFVWMGCNAVIPAIAADFLDDIWTRYFLEWKRNIKHSTACLSLNHGTFKVKISPPDRLHGFVWCIFVTQDERLTAKKLIFLHFVVKAQTDWSIFKHFCYNNEYTVEYLLDLRCPSLSLPGSLGYVDTERQRSPPGRLNLTHAP
jgi:hypothetical protein